MDFKSFKKVFDDKHKAVLQNDVGHQIHIAKASLSPGLHSRLSKLPLYQSNPEAPVPSPDAEPAPAPGGEQKGVTININSGTPTPTPVAAMPTPQQPQQPEVPDSPVPPQQAQPPAQVQPQQPAQQEDPFASVPGYKEGAAGAMGTANALQQQGNSVATAEHAAGVDNEALFQQTKRDLQAKAADMQAVTDDIAKGHINPNHYLESKSTAGRIATAVGLLLGGISSGVTGQPNPALTFLNKQIENDLESQKSDMANKHNLLSALQQQYQDIGTASNMFRAIRANTLANQVGEAMGKSQGAQAKAAGMTAIGALKQQAGTYLRQAALATMRSGVDSGDSSGVDRKADQYRQAYQAVNGKGDEEFEKHFLPSIGTSKVPLEPKDRDLIQKKIELKGLLDRASAHLTNVSGTLGDWSLAKKAEGTTIQDQIRLKMGELADLTRFTPEENKIYSQVTPDLTGTHFTNKDKTLLKGLIDSNNTAINTFYKQKGINKQQQDDTAVKGANGKMYKPSADGRYMVPVK